MSAQQAFHKFSWPVVGSLLLVGLLAGCQNPEPITDQGAVKHTVKERGVYTTLALQEHALDMPGSGYVQKSAFGPDETPAAVIIGYGHIDRQESVRLELVELSTGRILASHDYYASYGKAKMQPLAIRLSGEYKLRLLLGDTEFDTCQFSVTRRVTTAPAPAAPSEATVAYAKGVLDVMIQSDANSELFKDYDDKLDYKLLRAMILQTRKHPDVFAQRMPGRVVIQCRMDSQGAIAEPKVIENSEDEELGRLFEGLLVKGSPYGPWPEGAQRKLSSRQLRIAFGFN